MFIGTSLYVFFQTFPVPEAQQMLHGQRQAEQILPFFVINYLPPGFCGVVIAATLAAAMSSLDSSINAISTVTVVDIYKRHLVKNRADRHYLHMAWLFASLAGAVMIGGALVLVNVKTKTLQDTGIILSSVVAGGMLGIYLLGFFTRVRGSASVWTGITFTAAFTIWTILSSRGLLPEWLSFKYDLYYTIFIGNTVMFIVGALAYYFIGRIFKKSEEDYDVDIDAIYK
jgi:SSS family solute:Na+ symporter